MRKRRHLTDLYIRGKEVSVDDGAGEPVPIWLQKLNEIEREAVLRRANATKARYSLESQHEESELFVATLGSVNDFLDQEGKINLVIGDELRKARERIEAQLTHDEEGWGKDDKIQTLIDAWTGSDESPGLAARYAEDENDPEALRIKNEIEAFEADVNRRIEEERRRLVDDQSELSDLDLSRLATKEILKRKADDVFMSEWSRQQIFYSVREPDDHHKRYFGTVAEVDDLDDRVREFLNQQCNALFVDLREGKDLPVNPASSTSSESTSEADASNGSGLEAVNG